MPKSTRSKSDRWQPPPSAVSSMTTALMRVWDAAPDRPAEFDRHILSLTFSEQDKKRAHELAELVKTGEYTPAEWAELDGYNYANELLMLLQAKSRLSLARQVGRSA